MSTETVYPTTKISDLIQKLTEIKEKEGDLEIYIEDVAFGTVPLITDEIDVWMKLHQKK
jgi:hypothetical protein